MTVFENWNPRPQHTTFKSLAGWWLSFPGSSGDLYLPESLGGLSFYCISLYFLCNLWWKGPSVSAQFQGLPSYSMLFTSWCLRHVSTGWNILPPFRVFRGLVSIPEGLKGSTLEEAGIWLWVCMYAESLGSSHMSHTGAQSASFKAGSLMDLNKCG